MRVDLVYSSGDVVGTVAMVVDLQKSTERFELDFPAGCSGCEAASVIGVLTR